MTTGSVDLLQEWVHESHNSAQGANRRPHFDSGVGVRGTPERLGAGPESIIRRRPAMKCRSAMVAQRNDDRYKEAER
jgi:hypothetical protein